MKRVVSAALAAMVAMALASAAQATVLLDVHFNSDELLCCTDIYRVDILGYDARGSSGGTYKISNITTGNPDTTPTIDVAYLQYKAVFWDFDSGFEYYFSRTEHWFTSASVAALGSVETTVSIPGAYSVFTDDTSGAITFPDLGTRIRTRTYYGLEQVAVTFTALNIPESANYRIERIGGVPEPATWGLMIAGFGLTGVALRSRRRLATVAIGR